MISSYDQVGPPRIEPDEFCSDIVRNLYASCSDGKTPAWLDQDGRIVGIFARIIDQLRFWITGRSLLEENFVELCTRLGTTGRAEADPYYGLRSYSATACLADLYHITVLHADNFVLNSIRLISMKVTSREQVHMRDTSLGNIDRGIEAVEKHTLKDLSEYCVSYKKSLELPDNLKRAGRAPYGLYNLTNTCFANASLQFLLNMRFFNELLDHDVTQERGEELPVFTLRREIQNNLKTLRGLLARDYQFVPPREAVDNGDRGAPTKEQTDLEVYRELRILWGRIRCFSQMRGRELQLMEEQEDAREFIALLFELLQADRQERQAYHFGFGCRTQVERLPEDAERGEDFNYRQDPIHQPMITIGNSLRAIAHFYQRQGLLAEEGLTMQQILDVHFASWPGNETVNFAKWGNVERNILRKRDFLVAGQDGPPRQFIIHLHRFPNDGARVEKDSTLVDTGLRTKRDAHLITLYFHDPASLHRRRYKATYCMQTLACHHGQSLHQGHYYTAAVRDMPSPTGAREKKWMYLNDNMPSELSTQSPRVLGDINSDVYLTYFSLRNVEEIPLDSAEADPSESAYHQIQDEDLIIPPPPKAPAHAKEALLAYFRSDPESHILALEEMMRDADEAGLTLPQYLRMMQDFS